jgi:hypothetical protein
MYPIAPTPLMSTTDRQNRTRACDRRRAITRLLCWCTAAHLTWTIHTAERSRHRRRHKHGGEGRWGTANVIRLGRSYVVG